MKKLWKVLFVGIVLAQTIWGGSSCSAVAVPTSDGSYLHDFVVDFYLTRDEAGVGHMRVVETIDATFPERDRTHGLVRVIPFTNQDGKNLTMKSDRQLDLAVTRNGKPEPVANFEVGDGYFRVYLGDEDVYLHGEQTYTLKYEFEDVITEQSGDLGDGIHNWQELYWDTNGNDWGNSFDNVIATLHMDADLAEQYLDKNACYVGKYGEKGSGRCVMGTSTDGQEITFSTGEVDPQENLSFVLAFEPGTFVVPENPKSYTPIIVLGIITLTGGAIIAFVAVKYHKTKAKRNYYHNLFVKPEYTPMRDVTVAEMAKNSMKSLSGNSQVATLMELAVSEKIAIHKSIKEGKLRNKNIWSIEILSDDFLPEQKDILKILNDAKDFQKGDKFELKKRDYDAMAELLLKNFSKEVDKKLEQLELFESDKKAKQSNFAFTIFLITFWGILAIIATVVTDESCNSYYQAVGAGWATCASIIVMALVSVVALSLSYTTGKYRRRTEKGLEVARYLEGLKLYIKMAEADRIKFLQSVKGADTSHQGVVNLYEKLLPYAVIFGLEKSWLREMSKYYEFDDVSSPSWYIGTGAFLASDFSSTVSEMNSFAGSSISHSTTNQSSSSGSGFSGGGGSSGGGGGGGGGGTW